MKKRGQATVFVIIGIVILAVVLLLFFFKDKIAQTLREEPTNPQEYLTQQLDDIKNEVGRCVSQETNNAAKLLMENGGDFELPYDYIRYYNVSYPILCREFNGTEGCLAEPILFSNLGVKLSGYLPAEINQCLNLEDFRNKDYEVNTGNLSVVPQIFDENIIVDVNFPIELRKGAYLSEANSFSYNLEIPLGTLTNVANDLVQTKAEGREIDTILYGLLSYNKYRIQVRKPYPDELYDVSLTTNENYHFYFSVEGVGRFPRSAERVR